MDIDYSEKRRGLNSKQKDTLNGSIILLVSAWNVFTDSVLESAFGTFLKDIVSTATEVLSLASGTARPEGRLTPDEKRIRNFAKKVIFFGKIEE